MSKVTGRRRRGLQAVLLALALTTTGCFDFDNALIGCVDAGLCGDEAEPSFSTAAALVDSYVGEAYSQPLLVADGTQPLAYALTAGALPEGMSLSTSGELAGTPTAEATRTFTVTVTDRIGRTAQREFTLQVLAPPAITTAGVEDAYLAQSYSAPLAVAGGKAPFSYALTAGELPPGITLSSAGSLTGTAAIAGQASFTVTATDANGRTAAQALTLEVFPLPTLPSRTLADAYLTTPYGETLTATGGKAPLSYSVTSGANPEGLVFNSDGTFGGAATATGSGTFTVTVSDANGRTHSQSYTVAALALPQVTTSELLDGYRAEAYSAAFSASGGRAPLSFSLSGGVLPAGLSLSSNGTLTGSPSASATTQTFTVLATDANGVTASRQFTLAIYLLPVLPPDTLVDGYLASPYAESIAALNGKAPISYLLSSGTLPAGIAFANGAFSGTPTAATAPTTLNIEATDANGRTVTRSYQLGVYAEPSITTTGFSDQYTGTNLSGVAVGTSGGKAPLSFAVTGMLPPGLTLDGATGAITGNPTTPGEYPFTVQLTDGNGHQDSAALSLTVFAPPTYLSGPQLVDGVKNSAYTETVQVTGGKTPLTFVLSGSLPTGLTLNPATGVITGTPTVVNPVTFFLQVNDANGRSSPNSQFSITIYDRMQVNTGTNLPPAYQDVAYSQQLVVIGGKAPFSWALDTGSTLPADLALTTGGEITGSALAPALDHVFTVVVTDANSTTATKSFNLDVVGLPVIASDPLPDAYVGVPFTASVQVSGGKTPYVFSKSAGTFPSGINQASAGSNDLVGTPNLAGVSNFTMRVTDANAKEDSRAFTLTTYAVPDVSTASVLNDAYQGQAFTQTLAVSGGKSPFTWELSSGSPPAGLTLGADGVLSGTPTGTGAASFSATVTDSNGKTATRPFTQTVRLPVTLSATFSDGYVGRSYGPVVLSGAGGRSPYTFALASGSSLPAGLTLVGDSVSGTPTAAVSAAGFTLEVRDANNTLGTHDFSLDVFTPPSVATASLPDAYSGTGYSTSLLGQDGAGGYSWRLSAGTLPTGLTLNASGELAGTTTQVGTHSLTVEVTDANGIAATRVLSLIVRSPLQVTTTTLADAYLSRSYTATLTAGGGLAPYSFQLTGGTLPASLAVASDGTLSGTPDVSGTFTLDVQVTDANGASATATLQLRVRVLPQVTTASLPDGYEQRDYAATLAATGGKTPYLWTVTAGTLPAGLTLASSGTLTGRPTAVGSHVFTVTATDNNGQTGSAELTIDVHAPLQITTAALPDAYLTLGYDFTAAASGGPAGGYTWTATGLPAGVTLNTGTGQLTGIPTASGNAQVALTVTDGNGLTANRTLSLETYPLPRFTSSSPLADGYVGSGYAPVLVAADGKPPYTLSTVDPLPPGLTLQTDGTFTGTVSGGAGSTYSFSVQLQDSNSVAVSATFAISVRGTLVVDTTSVADLYTDTAYNLPFAASGGLTPYTWSLASGSSAPAGMAFSSGVLSGTPTLPGTHGFTVRVADANARTAQATITAQIFAPPLVTTTALSEAFVGDPYSRTLTSTGGKAGFTWSATGLPGWLTLDPATGVLSGTPSVTETGAPFTVTVTDLNGHSDDQLLSVDVRNDFFITTSALPDAYLGAAYSAPFTASGGVLPYTWSGLTLPPGMTLDPSTGVLSGPPPAAGSHPVQVQATDDSGSIDTVELTLVVLRLPAVSTTALSDGYLTENFAQTLAVTDGKAPYTWSVSSGALPAGVTLTASTGALSGVPTTQGDHPVTFRVEDDNGQSATASLTLSTYSLPSDQTPSAPAAAYRGVAYSFTQQGSGGKVPLTWLASALPDGLSLNPATGEISGTPSATATSTTFTATVRDLNGREAQTSRTIPVNSPPRNTTPAFAGGWVNVAYSHPLTAADGVAPYSYSIPPGQLPAGLSVGLSGGVVAVTGTPQTAGTFSLELTVTDANGQTDLDTYTLEITPALQITTTSLPVAYAGDSSYAGALLASGGRPSYSFQLQSGSLPEGMTLNPDGTFSGGATTEAATTFVAEVTDANNSTDLQNLTLVVVAAPQLVAGTAPPAYLEELFVLTNSATGGVAPHTWSVTEGALPAGVTLDENTGELRGTPTTAGPASFTLTVSDLNGRSGSHAFSFTVLTPVQLNGGELVDAYIGRPYTAGIAGSGGAGPYQYFLTTSASPPTGIVLGTGGVISGTAQATATPGPYTFGITVQDANGRIDSASFSLQLYRVPQLATTTLASAYEGIDYRVDAAGSRQQILGQHGKPPLTVTVTGLPPGLVFNPVTREVSGIPAADLLPLYTVGVTVSDANNQTSGVNLSLNVRRPEPIRGGGAQAAAPLSSPITDMLTVYALTPQGAPAGEVGVRIRRNGLEYTPPREGVTGPDGRVVFSGLGLNGTTDTVDITANGNAYSNVTFAQLNAALVTVVMEPHELPGKRKSMIAAYDRAANEWFVFGGRLARGFPALRQPDPNTQEVCTSDVVRMRANAGVEQVSWEEVLPTGIQGGPGARAAGAMVKAGTDLLLFGGRDCNGSLSADLWAFNPGTGAWSQRSIVAPSPGARTDHGLATRGNSGDPVFLFGGRNNVGGNLNDLWVYQPGSNSWSQRTAVGPTPRGFHAMAVHPLSGDLWVCGGLGGGTAGTECWSYSDTSNTWTSRPALPQSRYAHQMVFSDNGDLYLFGGYSPAAPVGFRNDLLRYSGGSWLVETSNGAATSPLPRMSFAMAFEPLNNRILVYGGNATPVGGSIGALDGSVWSRNIGGSSPWVRLNPPSGPGPLVRIAGTISGGATSAGASIEVTLSTASGERRTLNFGGASGSFNFDNLPAGEQMRITAFNNDPVAPLTLGNYLSQDLGVVLSNQTVNLTFGSRPAVGSSGGTGSFPAGWQPNPWVDLKVFSALPGMPSFMNRSGNTSYSAPASFNLNYFQLPGLETTARLSTESLTPGTCASVTSHRRNLSGPLSPWILPELPGALSPGRSECASFGEGLGDPQVNSAPNAAHDVVAGDFNEDGFPDLVVGSRFNEQVLLYLNDGLGGFFDTYEVTSSVSVAGSLEVADLDGDGHLDLLVADTASMDAAVVLYGVGDGTFEAAVESFLNKDSPGPLETATIGDFNNDGRLDFAVNDAGAGRLFITLGNGSRTFVSGGSYAIPLGVLEMKSADVNRDGFSDVVFVSHDEGSLGVLFGTSGGMSGPDTFSARPFSNSLALGDLDADGDLDVATTTLDAKILSLWSNDGAGFFTETGTVPLGAFATGVVIGEFSGGGEPDLVVLEGEEMTLIRNEFPDPKFTELSRVHLGLDPRTVIAADLNGDEALDVATAVMTNQEIMWSFIGRPVPGVIAGVPWTFTAPASSRLMKLERGAFQSSLDWVYFSPASPGPRTVQLPLPSTLRPSRGSPSNQLTSWSTTLVVDPSPVDVNNVRLQQLEPESFVHTGARVYLRQ